MHKIVVLFIIGLISVFGSVWHNFQIVKTGRIISQKEKTFEELKLQQRILDIKIANLKSLDRIEKISKEELGLTKVLEQRIIYSKDNVSQPKVVEIITKFMGNMIPVAQAETLEKN
mgnify:CR=1 FL=1